jgi:predicted small secreted protein
MRKAFASGLLAIFVLAGAAMLLAACNTAAGFGEDLQEAGHALTSKAQQSQSSP